MTRTAQFIEESKSLKPASGKRKVHPNSLANLAPYKYPKGVTGNPGGKNQHDIAQLIAQAVFENNQAEAYAAFSKAIRTGNAYVFKELAERAYGKLKESKEVTHIHQDVADADLDKRIADLERDLGLARAIDEAGVSGIAQAGAGTPELTQQDSKLLP
jgi:hypothetical protein